MMMTVITDAENLSEFYATVRGGFELYHDDTSIGGVWLRFGENSICLPNKKLKVEVWDCTLEGFKDEETN